MPGRAPAAPLHAAVQQALTEHGRSKLWLSRHSGVGRSTIERWRTQAQPPKPRTVLAVAEALGMDRDDAFRLAGITREEVALGEGADLSEVGTDALMAEIQRLLAELRRRIPPDA